MTPTESDLVGLVGLVYEATDDAEAWTRFLERYAQVFAADVAFIQRHSFAERSSRMLHTFGVSSPLRASYNDHYARVNIWRDRGAHKLQPGRVIVDDELCPRPTLVKSEFYNDYLLPLGAVRCVAGVIGRSDKQALMLAAMRGVRHSPFDETHKRALEVLLPHVTRARTIAERLGLVQGMESALDTLDAALVFATSTGEIIHCTAGAERILAREDGLAVRHRILTARDAAADGQLKEALRAAARSAPALDAPAAVLVERDWSRRPYQVLMMPVHHQVPALTGMRRADVVVLVVDPETQRPVSDELLMLLFRLTRREAALASALSAGMTIEQAADQLQMTYETARSHLRRIFGKTDTSRQSELVMMLARLPKRTGRGS